MPTYRVEVVLYVDADDRVDAKHIAKDLMTDFIRGIDITTIHKITEPRFERTMTVDELDQLVRQRPLSPVE